MKKIFLDCGFHHGEGLEYFINNGIITTDYKIYSFEANPACFIEERVELLRNKYSLDITSFNKAVWVEDGIVTFNQENHTKSGSGSPTDGASNIDGWGSSIQGIGFNHLGYETQVTIPSIDLSKFVNDLPNDSHIICKLDIEGAEFEILRKMIKENTASKIKEFYVEFHEGRMYPKESVDTKNEIISDLTKLGCKINTWF
jgi:FkbM family methyltransferase